MPRANPAIRCRWDIDFVRARSVCLECDGSLLMLDDGIFLMFIIQWKNANNSLLHQTRIAGRQHQYTKHRLAIRLDTRTARDWCDSISCWSRELTPPQVEWNMNMLNSINKPAFALAWPESSNFVRRKILWKNIWKEMFPTNLLVTGILLMCSKVPNKNLFADWKKIYLNFKAA